MLTTKQTTGLRTAASDYETLVQQAINANQGLSNCKHVNKSKEEQYLSQPIKL